KQLLTPAEYQKLLSEVSAPLDPDNPNLRELVKMLRERSPQRPSGSQLPPDTLKKVNEAIRELSRSPTPPDSVQQPKPVPSAPSPSPQPSTPDRPKVEEPQPAAPRPTPANPKEREAVAEQLRDWVTRMQQMNG